MARGSEQRWVLFKGAPSRDPKKVRKRVFLKGTVGFDNSFKGSYKVRERVFLKGTLGFDDSFKDSDWV